MAVVKADAYGHSAELVAPLLQKNGADAFAVSNLEEAASLRRCGIEKPILILGYTPTVCAKLIAELDCIQALFSSEYATELSAEAVKAGVRLSVHVKLDTGMSRIGFDCRNESLAGVPAAIKAASLPGFSADGVFTHFAVADRNEEEEDGFTSEQYTRFCRAVEALKAAGLPVHVFHCCNSAATCLDPDKHLSLCRPGILLYGLSPSNSLDLHKDFRPVMTLKSVISMVKTIRAGETVSYGRSFIAPHDMRIATVSAGYADGYPRALSNQGEVLIHHQKAPIIGRICMDQFSVDVSKIEQAQQGDEVILFGNDLPVGALADLCGTIHYELVCGISPRVPRVPVGLER